MHVPHHTALPACLDVVPDVRGATSARRVLAPIADGRLGFVGAAAI